MENSVKKVQKFPSNLLMIVRVIYMSCSIVIKDTKLFEYIAWFVRLLYRNLTPI